MKGKDDTTVRVVTGVRQVRGKGNRGPLFSVTPAEAAIGRRIRIAESGRPDLSGPFFLWSCRSALFAEMKVYVVDEAKIYVKGRRRSGTGAWRSAGRSTCRADGPSGGDGGNGAAFMWKRTRTTTPCALYAGYNREFKADRGRHGEGFPTVLGASGGDTILKVPVGTLVFGRRGGCSRI